MAVLRFVVMDRNGEGLLRSDDYDELLAAGDAGVEQVPLQKNEVLNEDRYHHDRVLRALRLMDRCGAISSFEGLSSRCSSAFRFEAPTVPLCMEDGGTLLPWRLLSIAQSLHGTRGVHVPAYGPAKRHAVRYEHIIAILPR